MTQITHVPAHVSRNGARHITDQWVVNHPMFAHGLSFATRGEAEVFAAAMEAKTMTLHIYATGEAIRDLTGEEVAIYLDLIVTDNSHTGAVPGDAFGLPGVTVYAI